jgi:predicted nucleic acid binding AN1-type Zn finger protein
MHLQCTRSFQHLHRRDALSPNAAQSAHSVCGMRYTICHVRCRSKSSCSSRSKQMPQQLPEAKRKSGPEKQLLPCQRPKPPKPLPGKQLPQREV